jgi:hypothetical protein
MVFFIDQRLRAFITNADFGPLYQPLVIPGEEDRCVVEPGSLQNYLPTVLSTGIVTSSIIIRLFLMYIKHHRLQLPNDPQVWCPNHEMLDYLGEEIVDLAEQRKLLAERRHNEGLMPGRSIFRPKDRFITLRSLTELYQQPYEMTFAAAGVLAALHKISYTDLDQQDRDLLTNQQLLDDLDDEELLLRDHIECLKRQEPRPRRRQR